MTLRQFLLALRYRWRRAAAVCIASLVVVLVLAAILMPTRYRASAELLIEEENRDVITGMALPSGGTPNRLITEADVVRSERVVLRALKSMGALDRPDLRKRWQEETGGSGDFNAWLVEALLKTTDVRPTRDSRVLAVAHTGRDPVFAAEFVNAVVKAYIDTAVELRVEPARQYNAFFDDRASQLRARLHEAQQRASEFHRRNGITTMDEKLDVEDARLAELSQQVVGLQARAGEAQRRQNEATASPDRMEEVLKDPSVSALVSALAVQETRHAELSERMGPRHPQVVESQAIISGLRSRLEQAKRRIAASYEGGSKVLSGQLAERSRALEVQRERVLRRKGLRDEARLLQNEVDVAQRAYDSVIDRLNKTMLEKAAPQVNVSILKVASAPPMAATALAPARMFTGVVIGLLLALITVVFTELRDRRLRTAQDVLSSLRQPVLAVLRERRASGTSRPTRPLLGAPTPALSSE